MTKMLSLKFAAAFVAALGVSNAVAAPKFVDVSKGRLEIGQNINFENYKSEGKIDKVNGVADDKASNAAVRLKLSCVQSALGCTGGSTVIDNCPGGNNCGTTVVCPDGNCGTTNVCPDGNCGTTKPEVSGNGPFGPGPQGPAQLPNLSNLTSAATQSAIETAAACVQDESFCKDANLKRVANRNSVIDEIFFYTEL